MGFAKSCPSKNNFKLTLIDHQQGVLEEDGKNVDHCENEDVIVIVIVFVIVIVIFSVAIHPDGLYIAAGFGDKIRLLNILIGSNSKS